MGRIPFVNLRFLAPVAVISAFLVLLGCGTAAPDTPVPAAPTQVPAAATQPPATLSAQVGQGAVGAVPTPVPTATVAAMPATPPASPAVTSLKFARVTTTNETNDPSLSGRADLPFLLPMYEGLVQFDQFTDSQPMLATSWETNADFTQWTFTLRRGVAFHKGWGEVKAKDVVHTMGQERRMDHFDARGGIWRELIDRVDTPDGPDGYQVAFHLTKPEPIMITYMSTNYTTVIRSQDRWNDAGGLLTSFEPNEAGIKVMQDDPIGTGPYQFVERAEAQFIRFEGLDYEHWRKTPDFPDLQIFFVPESSTRLAMLVTEEVNSAEIPRDLQAGALNKGMSVITGTTPAIRLVGFFGGNYLPSRPEYIPDAPVTNPKVREAMNRAINRQEINEVFLGGRSELMMQTHSHPKFPGWEPSWPGRFEEAYGYDPERAKELLTEAGYPDGFTITQHAYPRPGLPEMLDIGELVNSYWKAVGIDVKFEPVEVATQTSLRRDYKTANTVWLHTGSFTEPTRAIFVYHYDPSRFHGFDDEFFFEKYQELEVAGSAEQRDSLIREMGEYCFETYCTIPLFWIPYEFMVNPKQIADWKTPGVFSARDFEYVQAAR